MRTAESALQRRERGVPSLRGRRSRYRRSFPSRLRDGTRRRRRRSLLRRVGGSLFGTGAELGDIAGALGGVFGLVVDARERVACLLPEKTYPIELTIAQF